MRLSIAVFVRAWQCFMVDRIPLVAAGATFFILLALFPGFASIVMVYGMLADRADIAHEMYRVSAFLPRGAVITLNIELQRLIAQPPQTVGFTFVASTIIAVWSASGGVRGVIEGLDVAYEVKESRSPMRLFGSSLLLTVLGIVAAVISLNIVVVLPVLFADIPYRGLLRQTMTFLSWPTAFGFSMLTLSLVYHFGPSGQRQWTWFSWGAVLASGMWLGGTAVFKHYIQYFGSFDRIYGGFGAIMGFMV